MSKKIKKGGFIFMIQINDLSIGYVKNNPVMSNINLTFENGKIYGLLGESGKGKTTLIKTIAGLQNPLSGKINYEAGYEKKNIYMMHQNYTSFDWLSCLDNVILPAKINKAMNYSKNKKIIKENAVNILNRVGLGECIKKYPSQLSGGMRQRLALARTIFANPKVLLMDEPLSALDKSTRGSMQQLILEEHKISNNLIILITHSEEEAKIMCDEIIKF